MLPAETFCAYNFAVPQRIVLWQQVGDIQPLGGFTKEKFIAGAGIQTRQP